MSTHRKPGEPKSKIEVWLQDFHKLRQLAREALSGDPTGTGTPATNLDKYLTELDNLYGPIS